MSKKSEDFFIPLDEDGFIGITTTKDKELEDDSLIAESINGVDCFVMDEQDEPYEEPMDEEDAYLTPLEIETKSENDDYLFDEEDNVETSLFHESVESNEKDLYAEAEDTPNTDDMTVDISDDTDIETEMQPEPHPDDSNTNANVATPQEGNPNQPQPPTDDNNTSSLGFDMNFGGDDNANDTPSDTFGTDSSDNGGGFDGFDENSEDSQNGDNTSADGNTDDNTELGDEEEVVIDPEQTKRITVIEAFDGLVDRYQRIYDQIMSIDFPKDLEAKILPLKDSYKRLLKLVDQYLNTLPQDEKSVVMLMMYTKVQVAFEILDKQLLEFKNEYTKYIES